MIYLFSILKVFKVTALFAILQTSEIVFKVLDNLRVFFFYNEINVSCIAVRETTQRPNSYLTLMSPNVTVKTPFCYLQKATKIVEMCHNDNTG